MTFTDKVVLVAGGTGGLGRAVSLAFLEAGAQVIVTYQHDTEFAELHRLASNAARLVGRMFDLTDEAAVEQLIDGIVREHARLDVMVNTVGAYTGGPKFWELRTDVFERMLALNLRAGFLLSRAAAGVMVKQQQGAIVNVAAKAAIDHGAGAAYAASKSAALAMIDSLAADLKGTGVRANSILPSIIDTEANRKAMPGSDFSKWPKPEAIARVVLFLCSDDARVVQGAAVSVYGDS
ncbi:MAG TPA: SDR family NAD(P)-dependent oxidoreductase [Candidatus Angelobacter sp.]|nr:SDR family NAD(P)-dependent oxidoreductase [Candidatus Angelobacter sp.]